MGLVNTKAVTVLGRKQDTTNPDNITKDNKNK